MASRKWLLIFGTISFTVLALMNWGYRYALESLKTELDDRLSERLLALAEDLAVQVDASSISAEGNVEEFVSLFDKVREYRRTHGLADVRLVDTGFVDLLAESADTLSTAIVSRLDYPTFLAARSGFSAVSETYRWEDGYYKSAYAPVLDSADRVAALVRVEADAGFFAVVEVFERGRWAMHLLSVVFLLAVGGLFVWFFRRQAAWERQLLLSEKLLAMGRMASVIAHEIRNPLGIIKATAQRLAKLEPEKQQPLLQFIPEEVDRLEGILTGYLQFADIRVQPPQPVRLAALFAAVRESTAEYCRTREVRLAVQGDDQVAACADRDALRHALENLIRNAVDASAVGGEVVLDCRAAGRKVSISVADRGPGVPKKDRRRIFEPFFTTRAQGSGLGLYAARTAVAKMGGTVRYHPRHGGGSMLVIELPIHPGGE